MQHVWIVTIKEDYEGEEHIGVFLSKPGAIKACEGHIAAQFDYFKSGPRRDDCFAVEWRISDLFTLMAVRREVNS